MFFQNVSSWCELFFCQPVSCAIQFKESAARSAIAGASPFEISSLLGPQLLVGFVSIALGYVFFRSFENVARKTGRIEAM